MPMVIKDKNQVEERMRSMTHRPDNPFRDIMECVSRSPPRGAQGVTVTRFWGEHGWWGDNMAISIFWHGKSEEPLVPSGGDAQYSFECAGGKSYWGDASLSLGYAQVAIEAVGAEKVPEVWWLEWGEWRALAGRWKHCRLRTEWRELSLVSG